MVVHTTTLLEANCCYKSEILPLGPGLSVLFNRLGCVLPLSFWKHLCTETVSLENCILGWGRVGGHCFSSHSGAGGIVVILTLFLLCYMFRNYVSFKQLWGFPSNPTQGLFFFPAHTSPHPIGHRLGPNQESTLYPQPCPEEGTGQLIIPGPLKGILSKSNLSKTHLVVNI